jgi:hypothetical protein
MSLTTLWMPSVLNMILMKIDDNGELQADWEEIARLSQSFDDGCKSEEAYKAKLFTLVLDRGYEAAIDAMEENSNQLSFMLASTGGNA